MVCRQLLPKHHGTLGKYRMIVFARQTQASAKSMVKKVQQSVWFWNIQVKYQHSPQSVPLITGLRDVF